MIAFMTEKNLTRDTRFKSAAPEGWPMTLNPLALASSSCVFCRGLGVHPSGRRDVVCSCVYRQVFRVCLSRYYHERDKAFQHVRLEVGVGAQTFTCPGAEYIADFENVSMKALPVGVMRTIMQIHFFDGHDYKHSYCLAQKVDKTITLGNYWHAIYRIQELAGKRLVTIQPCRLYPLDEYFTVRGAIVALVPSKRQQGQHIAAVSDPVESWPYPTKHKLREMRMQRAA